MVAFNNPVPFCFVATASQRTTVAILSLISVNFLDKAILCFALVDMGFSHRLLHRTITSICFRVVKEVIGMERVLLVLLIALLFVEVVVFHKCRKVLFF